MIDNDSTEVLNDWKGFWGLLFEGLVTHTDLSQSLLLISLLMQLI